MWSSMSQWILGVTACEPGTTVPPDELQEQRVEGTAIKEGQEEQAVPVDSVGKDGSTGTTSTKKTTVLIMVAPPKDLQQVLQRESKRKSSKL